MAMTGDASSITTGTITATERMRRVEARSIFTAAGDISITGSNVQADIDQSEVMAVPVASAPSAGSRSGAQNAAATNRRSASAGQTISASAALFGRAAINTSATGSAT